MCRSQLMALAVMALGCSGGRDPVRTVGGNGEYAGPGAGDPYGGSFSDPSGSPTATSTMVALCTNACAHIHAADCDASPKHTTDQCELECQFEASNASPCTDEVAALYQCTIHAKVTCATSVSGEPEVAGCAAETNALSQCTSPGSGCTASPESDDICFSVGLSHFLFCSSGTAPPSGCLPISDESVCCP